MSDVIPEGSSAETEFLFDRMTEVTLALAAAGRGRRVLDVASGVGQDAVEMARRGAAVVGAEPSARMIGMAELVRGERGGVRPEWVRGWSDGLPFASASFDAAICKGAIDHFDRPEEAIAEMARVVRPQGRVVLAIANFESLACRIQRGIDDLREEWLRRAPERGRRAYDCPSDHFTRYELELMKEQAHRHLELEVVHGVSLVWGVPGWSRLVAPLPARAARRLLQVCDAAARLWPSLADVVVLAGRPRRSATTSA